MQVNRKSSESFCQIFCISFLHKLQKSGHDFLVWSTPNGGSRNKVEAGRLKLEGCLSGVLDITLMSKGIIHFIELKTKSGVLSENQKAFIASAERYGFGVTIIKGDAVAEVLPQVMAVMNKTFNIPLIDMHPVLSETLKNSEIFLK